MRADVGGGGGGMPPRPGARPSPPPPINNTIPGRPPAGPPPAPYSTPVPDAHVYGQMANQAKLAWQDALAKIGSQRSDLLRQYGYEGDVGEDGQITNLRVSANSPYGLIQQMYRGQADESDQADVGMRQRGFATTSGADEAALGDLRFQQGQKANEIGTSLMSGISDLVNAQRSSTTDYNNALGNAELEATRYAIENQGFNPGDYSGLPEDSYGNPTAPGVPRGNPGTGQGPGKKKPNNNSVAAARGRLRAAGLMQNAAAPKPKNKKGGKR